MANILLGLEIKRNDNGQLETVVKDLRNIDDVAAKAGGSLSKIFEGINIGAGIAIFENVAAQVERIAGAVPAAVSQVGQLSEKFLNLQASSGNSLDTIQDLALMAQVGTSSLEDLATGVGKMQKNLAEGSAATRATLDGLGLSLDSLKSMEPAQAMDAILLRIQQLPDPADRTAAAMALLGKSGASLLPLAGQLGALAEKAQELNIRMSGETIRSAADLDDKFDLLRATSEGLVNQFGGAITTSESLHVAVEGLTQIVGQMSGWVKNNQQSIREWVDFGMVFAIQALIQLVGVIEFGMATLKALADMWTGLKFAAIGLYESYKLVFELMTKPWNASQYWNEYKTALDAALTDAGKELDSHQQALDQVAGAGVKARDVLEQLRAKIEASVGAHHAAAAAAQTHNDKLHFVGAEALKAAEALEKARIAQAKADSEANAAAQALVDKWRSLLGPTTKQLQDQFDDLTTAVESYGGITNLTIPQLEAYERGLNKIAAAADPAVDVSAQLAEVQLLVRDRLLATGQAVQLGNGYWSRYADVIQNVRKEHDQLAPVVLTASQRLQQEARDLHALADIAAGVGSILLGLGADSHSFGVAFASSIGASAAAGAQFAEAWEKAGDSTIAKAAAVVGALQAISAQAQQTANATQRTMQGAASGAAVGAAFGPTGAIVGALAGGLLAYFSGPDWEHTVQIGAQTFDMAFQGVGSHISDQLARAIHETAIELNITDAQASLLHLADFVQASSGDMREAYAGVVQLINSMAAGLIPVHAGMQELSADWDLVRQSADAAGVVGDRATREILAAAQATGHLTSGMKDFLSGLQDQAAGGKDLIATGFARMDPDFLKSLGTQWGASAATSFNFGFQAEINKNGVVAALDKNGQQLHEFYDRMVASGNDAGAKLLQPFIDLDGQLDENLRGMLQVTQGMDQVFKSQADGNQLTRSGFEQMQAQILATDAAMRAKGVSDAARIEATRGQLVDLAQAGAQYNFAMSDSAQALAAEGGAIPLGPMQQMVDLLSDIDVRLGGLGKTALDTGATVTAGTDAATAGLKGVADGADDAGQKVSALGDNASKTLGDLATGAAATSSTISGAFAQAGADVSTTQDKASQDGIAAYNALGLAATTQGDWTRLAWGLVAGDVTGLADKLPGVTDAFVTMASDSTTALDPLSRAAADLRGALGGAADNASTLGTNLSNLPSGGFSLEWKTDLYNNGPTPKDNAYGGLYAPRAGGHVIRVAEAGQTEVVAPVGALLRNIGAGLGAELAGNNTSPSSSSSSDGRQFVFAPQLGPVTLTGKATPADGAAFVEGMIKALAAQDPRLRLMFQEWVRSLQN